MVRYFTLEWISLGIQLLRFQSWDHWIHEDDRNGIRTVSLILLTALFDPSYLLQFSFVLVGQKILRAIATVLIHTTKKLV